MVICCLALGVVGVGSILAVTAGVSVSVATVLLTSRRRYRELTVADFSASLHAGQTRLEIVDARDGNPQLLVRTATRYPSSCVSARTARSIASDIGRKHAESVVVLCEYSRVLAQCVAAALADALPPATSVYVLVGGVEALRAGPCAHSLLAAAVPPLRAISAAAGAGAELLDEHEPPGPRVRRARVEVLS